MVNYYPKTFQSTARRTLPQEKRGEGEKACSKRDYTASLA